MSAVQGKAIPDGYKWWIVASVAVLVVSLGMFASTVVAGFVYFTEKATPIWVTVLGVVSVLGMGAGAGGLFLILIFIAWKARQNDKKLAAEQG
jgi:uncharacterized membrane-anchored protein